MSKSIQKLESENRELRRQIELLKNQTNSGVKIHVEQTNPNRISKGEPEIKNKSKVDISRYLDSTGIKEDLLKSFILSILIFSIIFGIYFWGKF